jgi:hypothetical protein
MDIVQVVELLRLQTKAKKAMEKSQWAQLTTSFVNKQFPNTSLRFEEIEYAFLIKERDYATAKLNAPSAVGSSKSRAKSYLNAINSKIKEVNKMLRPDIKKEIEETYSEYRDLESHPLITSSLNHIIIYQSTKAIIEAKRRGLLQLFIVDPKSLEIFHQLNKSYFHIFYGKQLYESSIKTTDWALLDLVTSTGLVGLGLSYVVEAFLQFTSGASLEPGIHSAAALGSLGLAWTNLKYGLFNRIGYKKYVKENSDRNFNYSMERIEELLDSKLENKEGKWVYWGDNLSLKKFTVESLTHLKEEAGFVEDPARLSPIISDLVNKHIAPNAAKKSENDEVFTMLDMFFHMDPQYQKPILSINLRTSNQQFKTPRPQKDKQKQGIDLTEWGLSPQPVPIPVKGNN